MDRISEKITNPDDSFKKFLESVDEEDNPIIIIAYRVLKNN